jgi:diacylglycerol O-acyltransferase / wax synthase
MSRLMAPADAVWIRGDSPANQVVISAILWFDSSPDPDRLRAILEERLLERHPVFGQRVVQARLPMAMPRWEDDPDFSIGHHLQVITLPEPGDHALLEQRCSEERSHPLDPDRPLWLATLYQGYRGDGAALHVRIHHSLGDGLALMQLLLMLVDELDGTQSPLTDPLPLNQVTRRMAQRVVRRAGHLARHPGDSTELLRNAADTLAWSGRLLWPLEAPRSILQGVPGGAKRMAWSPDGLPVEVLKDAAHEHGVTVNDLLLAIMAGGLHRYLAAHEALVDEVLVMVPVNLRTPGEPLPRHLGNCIGLLPVLLPVGADDHARRLALVHERTQRLKSSRAPAVSRALLVGTTLVTPGVERAIHRLNQRYSTGVVTNVIGPDLELHLAGARLRGAIGWGGMTAHLNLGGGFISLGGRVFPGLVTDEAITPDPDRMLAHIEAEWTEVLGTAVEEKIPHLRDGVRSGGDG